MIYESLRAVRRHLVAVVLFTTASVGALGGCAGPAPEVENVGSQSDALTTTFTAEQPTAEGVSSPPTAESILEDLSTLQGCEADNGKGVNCTKDLAAGQPTDESLICALCRAQGCLCGPGFCYACDEHG